MRKMGHLASVSVRLDTISFTPFRDQGSAKFRSEHPAANKTDIVLFQPARGFMTWNQVTEVELCNCRRSIGMLIGITYWLEHPSPYRT